MPAVSVIMNCLNGEPFVRQAIQSIYDQTFSDWEIIFFDNSSIDRTAEIAKSFDNRLRYFRSTETVPLGAARRLAIAEATGTWIAFQDHDDVSLPHRLERQMEAISRGDFVACYGGMREIDISGRVVRDVLPTYASGDQFAQQLTQFEANLQTMVVNAGYLKRHDIQFDETFTMFEDYNLFMKLAAKGSVCAVPEVLCLCRILASSWTVRSLEHHASERFRTLAQLRADNPGIEQRYPQAFRDAATRGDYYRARYEMQKGDVLEAREIMRRIRKQAPIYQALYWLSWWPWAWNAAHGRTSKMKLTGLFLRRKER
jgi:glycosyltransferase involved in cell wall biosynthesis